MAQPHTHDPLKVSRERYAQNLQIMAGARRSLPQGLVKISGAREDMGQNPDSWESKATDCLYRRHSWSSKFRVRSHIISDSPQGYGLGVFYLTPENAPVAATGANQINVLTVPIMIDSYRLYPLDLFFYKGKPYPLTEDRATRLLTLPDIFKATDQTTRELDRRNDLSHDPKDHLFGRFLGAYGSRGKRSADDAIESRKDLQQYLLPTLVRCLKTSSTRDALSLLAALGVQTDSDTVRDLEASGDFDLMSRIAKKKSSFVDTGTLREFVQGDPLAIFDTPAEEIYREGAKLAGVEVRKTSAAYETRSWWISDPFEGKRKKSAWVAKSRYALTQAVSPRVMRRVDTNGYAFVGQGSRNLSPEVVTSTLVKKTSVAKAEVLSRTDTLLQDFLAGESVLRIRERVKSSNGNMVSVLNMRGSTTSAKAYPLLVVPPPKRFRGRESFKGVVLLPLDPDNPGRGPDLSWRMRSDMAFLTTEGTLLSNSSWMNSHEGTLLLPLSNTPVKSLPKIRNHLGVSFESLSNLQEYRIWYWLTSCGCAVYVTTQSTPVRHGEKNRYKVIAPFFSRDSLPEFKEGSDSGESFWVSTSDVKQCARVSFDGRNVLLIPKDTANTVIRPQDVAFDFIGIPPDKAQDVPDTQSASTEETTPPVQDSDEVTEGTIKLSSVRTAGHVGFTLEGGGCEDFGVLSRSDARGALHALGVRKPLSLLKKSQKNPVLLRYSNAESLRTNAEIVAEVNSRVYAQKHSAVQEFEDTVHAVQPTLRHTLVSLNQVEGIRALQGKASSTTQAASLDQTIDAVLSLGFLSRRNLRKFVAMRPVLEESLSNLCALLLASRIGLTEIPMEPLETAIECMEPILGGLNKLTAVLDS